MASCSLSATDPTSGAQLSESDSTSAGTVGLTSARSGFSPTSRRVVSSTLYFAVYDGVDGPQLWNCDGAAAGTAMVSGSNGSGYRLYPSGMIGVNGSLYFGGWDPSEGYQDFKIIFSRPVQESLLTPDGLPEVSEESSYVGDPIQSLRLRVLVRRRPILVRAPDQRCPMSSLSQDWTDSPRPSSELRSEDGSSEINARKQTSAETHRHSPRWTRLDGSLKRLIHSPAAKVSATVAGIVSLFGLTVSGRTEAIAALILVLAIAYRRVVLVNAEAHAMITAADAEAHAKKAAADAGAHATITAADAEAHAKKAAADTKAQEMSTRSECLSVITQDFVDEKSYGGILKINDQGAEIILHRAHSSRQQRAKPHDQPPYRVIG
jgi:ELWxxDGT repeat protein